MLLNKPLKTKSYAGKPTYDSNLANRLELEPNRYEENTWHLPLLHNDEALAWRINLIDQATSTIDAQYYSWNGDTSGLLLIGKLINAADRGVRVRLLLDDIRTFGADRRIAMLNNHKNIEVRLFNPFKRRWPLMIVRSFELLSNLKRLNHRMHNKLLITDNSLAILGGRNIGDEYLGLCNKVLFMDMDFLLFGQSIKSLSDGFDTFWNHDHTYVAHTVITAHPGKLAIPNLNNLINKKTIQHSTEIRHITQLSKNLLDRVTPSLFFNAKTRVLYDTPNVEEEKIQQVYKYLLSEMHTINKRLIIISAYFVPTEELMTLLSKLIEKGVSITLYTNSLASIDVIPPFSGYQKYRKQLLNYGIKIYEYKSNKNIFFGYFNLLERFEKHCLHSKALLYDDEKVFIGSFNVDPRSAKLNTEAGLSFSSINMTEIIIEHIERELETGGFWEVKLVDNRILWKSEDMVTRIQPARSILQRISNYIYSLLPVQKYL